MIEQVYNKLLIDYKYRTQVAELSKDTFIRLYRLVNPDMQQEELKTADCVWNEFSTWDILSKIKYIVESAAWTMVFEAYCEGFNDGAASDY